MLLSEPVGLLDYWIPGELAAEIEPGVAVEVSLRGRTTSAYVAQVVDGPPPEGVTLKPIARLHPDLPRLPPALLDVILFAADYYAAPAGAVLTVALPRLSRRTSRRYRLTDIGRAVLSGKLGTEDRAMLELARDGAISAASVTAALGWTRRRAAARLRHGAGRGWLAADGRRTKGPRTATAYRRLGSEADAGAALGPRQRAARALWEAIPAGDTVSAAVLAASHAGAYRHLASLRRAGLVEKVTVEQRVRPSDEPPELEGAGAPPEPTAAQAAALAALRASMASGESATFLLHGVTGSGKTEIYLRLIADALAAGRTALVLVPEIALTPQLGARFRARFGDRVATFHSGLTVAERRDEWERVAAGEAVIGLGARSALFLPLRDVGVIVVDEEHESSFKQEESPRYQARDLAVYRGRREGAIVVLGSATPALESRYNASRERYRLLVLPERVRARPLPEVTCIDMARADRVGDGVMSAELAGAVEHVLGLGEQVILFLNRRGFAPYVYCRDCGAPFRCEDCDVGLTLHRRRDVLLCHYCAFEMPTPEECPACHGLRLEAHGLGTERLDAEVRALFGDVPLARLDRDTIKTRADLNRELSRFGRGEARLLLGTQMVTKGHDFPGVTLVGVVAADVGLNFPDFRAAERTFQLLTQVAGRAGRGEKRGRVLVQTYERDHYAIRAAAGHDYEAFVERELPHRHELSYPPFGHLVLVRYEGVSEGATQRFAEAEAAVLRKRAAEVGGVDVLGPAVAPLARLRGRWRFHVLLKGLGRPALRAVVAALPRERGEDVRRAVDVDPVSML